jgi:hypothetical protein
MTDEQITELASAFRDVAGAIRELANAVHGAVSSREARIRAREIRKELERIRRRMAMDDCIGEPRQALVKRRNELQESLEDIEAGGVV